MKKANLSDVWSVDLSKIVGLVANVETVDGARRTQVRVSGVRAREVKVNGEAWPVPYALEVNDDSGDLIELEHVSRMELFDPNA